MTAAPTRPATSLVPAQSGTRGDDVLDPPALLVLEVRRGLDGEHTLTISTPGGPTTVVTGVGLHLSQVGARLVADALEDLPAAHLAG